MVSERGLIKHCLKSRKLPQNECIQAALNAKSRGKCCRQLAQVETAISIVHGSFRLNEETREATRRHISSSHRRRCTSRYRLQRKNSTYYSENLKSIATPDGTSLLNATNSSLAFSNRLKTSISTSQSFVPERARVNFANCVRV